MVASNDVSQNLDIIAQVPGDMLIRGAEGWERLPTANAGWTLTAQGSDPPAWQAGANAVRLNKTVTQSVIGGDFDPVTWNSAHFDDDDFWDLAFSNRITVPAGVSRMSFTGGVRSETAAPGTVLVVIRDQAGTQIARSQGRGGSDSVSESLATGPIMVTPGDWYELAFFTANFRVIAANLMTFFAAQSERYA